MYKVIYSREAEKDIDKLDFGLRLRIIKKIDFYVQGKNPLIFAKRLVNNRIGSYRFRVGDYRVIFDIESTGVIKILLILRIKHRKDIYCE